MFHSNNLKLICLTFWVLRFKWVSYNSRISSTATTICQISAHDVTSFIRTTVKTKAQMIFPPFSSTHLYTHFTATERKTKTNKIFRLNSSFRQYCSFVARTKHNIDICGRLHFSIAGRNTITTGCCHKRLVCWLRFELNSYLSFQKSATPQPSPFLLLVSSAVTHKYFPCPSSSPRVFTLPGLLSTSLDR